jgi:hypothetical protein
MGTLYFAACFCFLFLVIEQGGMDTRTYAGHCFDEPESDHDESAFAAADACYVLLVMGRRG